MASTVASPKKLRIGVMLEAVQLSDIVGIDILGNLSKEYMSQVKDLPPQYAAFESHAIDMEFFYIATTLDPAFMTPGLHFVPTVTYDTCPRDLDIVITGGPLLSHRPEQADRFMKEAWPKTRVWMTTCIGGLWLASSGVLDGKKCTTNREVLAGARKMHPEVEWLDQRWVVEEKVFEGEGKGELWTAGGAGAGECALVCFAR
jgi:transcriptional regulator GlxA family with amidase domain